MGETKRLTKKQLKTTAFRTKKKIKELIEDKTQALPDQDEEVEGILNEAEGQDNNTKKVSSSSSKKRKRDKPSTEDKPNDGDKQDEDADTSKTGVISTTASKRRKRKNAAKLKEKEDIQKRKTSKLILFIGNLPFDISVERLKSFFSEHCGEEPSVRLMTSKTSQLATVQPPTKGCGFIEFETSAALQKALRLHHTPLSAETEGPTNSRENVEKKARKINIELTAGGGGTSENRRKKIHDSHLRLAKQRDKILEKRIKSSTLEKSNNPTAASADPQFDVSIKLGSRPNPSKKSLTRPSNPTRFKPHFSGANAIRLG
ncbi:hypothetical protein MJO29_015468 [Puccinia striiformis f. sp. tritici]|uniref:hypothetical protein n=1 Tax=Puccinia striiformis f. sp. tritici TaxID=168172 RepID=UPI002007C47E|nr:hypothetical protein Pst134EA_029040 [Puccinia striiformis f. sp. tritici]KAH9447055.1 hypothetical protein Pst134EA_029040 [Puccinia striiformis f. sp. tritici]KAI7936165.1 hypothetical protein MJO29_015468 [Puccinia striiformis f. sp. tritici]